MIKQTMIDILNDTVNFYSKDPFTRRSVSRCGDRETGCEYLNKSNGNKCAIGRLLNEEDLNIIMDNNLLCQNSINRIILTQKYKFKTSIMNELPYRFLSDLQDLHDYKEYWIQSGISVTGIEKRDYILKKIENNEYV